MQDDVTELSDLLKDQSFVDFFNVFLSLPIFSQRVLYKFDQRNFEFDPPVKKSKYLVDKTKVIDWLVTERLPLFHTSQLYYEYLLSQQLQKTRLYFTKSSHSLDYEDYRQKEDAAFIQYCIGNVVGMRQFRYYLRDTVGQKLVNFWMDAECFKRLLNTNDLSRKWRAYRNMQMKYFKGKNLGTSDILENTDVVNTQNWSGRSRNYKNQVDMCYHDTPNSEFIKVMNSTNYSEIQKIILAVLRGYWLQRYVLHSKVLKDKMAKKAANSEAVYRILSKSDMAILKDIKEIDKALRLLQGNFRPNPEVARREAEFNWKAMFPENQVDGSFLDDDGDIITLHSNGSVSVDHIDSTLDDILAQYISADMTSSSDDSPSTDESRQQTRTSDKTVEVLRTSSPLISSECGRAMSAMSGIKHYRLQQQEISKPTSREKHLNVTDKQRPLTTLEKIANIQSKKDYVVKEHEDTSALDLMRQVVNTECKQWSISRQNKYLFDQILQLNVTYEVQEKGSDIKERPQSSPMKLYLKRNTLQLPVIRSKTQCGGKGDHSYHGNIELDPQKILRNKHKVTLYHEQMVAGHSAISIEPPTFKYMNMCQGYFRYDNQLFVLCIATDSVAGSPFEIFLTQNRYMKQLTCLNFWNDVQSYFCTVTADRNVKVRKANFIMIRYVLNKHIKIIPEEIRSPLKSLLPLGQGDDILREAQDSVCKTMCDMLQLFKRKDRRKFLDSCIVKKQRYGYNRKVGINHMTFMNDTVHPSMKTGGVQRSCRFEQEEMLNKDEKGVVPPDKENRMIKAAQLALDAANLFDECLPVDKILYEELEWDPKNHGYGSLFIDKLVLIQRRDLVEYKQRLKLVAQQKKARLEMEQLKLEESAKTAVPKDDTPFYMKPFKKHGLWYHRPNRPRTFQDVIRDHVHREFFRRFLIYNTSESPMNYFNAVEDLKNCTEARAKQNKMNQITKKYFSSVAHAIDLLHTNADIIQAIPAQEKVTMAMLISAQSWVSRSLNDHWFEKYQITFPEVDNDVLLSGAVRMLTNGGTREWGKERTRALWQSLVRCLIHFRRDILNPTTVNHFAAYLKYEIRQEIDKQKFGHGYIQGMPVRKVIRNKLVDVTKLVNDLFFVAEADRYRTIADDARHNASVGTYCVTEDQMLANKAKMIIDCFIDSDIPPKTQINLTQEHVENVMAAYKSGLFDRSLFHAATLSVFPVVVHLWKKFEKYQYVQLIEKWEEKRLKKKIGDLAKVSKMTEITEIPDYVNATLNNITTKRIIPNKGEEDICKLTFSLSKGIKMILPIFTNTNFGFGTQKEDSIMLDSASGIDGLNKGPSFLRIRRDGRANSQLGIHADPQSAAQQQSSVMSHIGRHSSMTRKQSSMSRHGSNIVNKPITGKLSRNLPDLV